MASEPASSYARRRAAGKCGTCGGDVDPREPLARCGRCRGRTAALRRDPALPRRRGGRPPAGLTTRQGEVLAAVDEHGSFSAAARALGVSRQAVSAIVKYAARHGKTRRTDSAGGGES